MCQRACALGSQAQGSPLISHFELSTSAGALNPDTPEGFPLSLLYATVSAAANDLTRVDLLLRINFELLLTSRPARTDSCVQPYQGRVPWPPP